MTLVIGTKLGPYEILERIGAGGMGEVWKARDTRLGRIVAIKKVKEQHSERFRQEARTIAALNHSNICQLHDIGEDYLVLEYVQGKPLSSPLPEKDAISLAIQIAAALEAAHKKGIIHRDLKPGNIMVTAEGSVKLLDFGLAKLYEQSASESTAEFPATQAGAVLGTVAYMSPEQAQGQPADARSDIFSFGLVLYEMLSGRRAFSGDTPMAVGAALLKEEPSALQVSAPLQEIVKRCLAKQLSARYQSISEIKSALERIAEEKKTISSTETQPSIAVLPFVNMSGDKEQEYFSDGLAEEIINVLAHIPGLRVAGRTSSFFFRSKDVEFAEIGKRLNVEHILEGSVRRSGSSIRVTAQLIKVADGFHLWSERYDRSLTDVFAIQDEIAEAIADALKIKLSITASDQRRHEPNLVAHEAYLKARYHFGSLSPESLNVIKGYFEQAIASDPDYAQPWFGLATYYWFLGNQGIMPAKAASAKCREALLKALELDEMLPESHSLLGVLKVMQFDWTGAEGEFRRALELGPKAFDVWMHYSIWYLLPMGRLNEAVAAARRAVDMDPLSPIAQHQLGTAYLLAREYDQAIEQFGNVLACNPRFGLAHLFLGFARIITGRPDEGITSLETGVHLLGRTPLSLAFLASAYGRAGRIIEAHKLLAELQDLAHRTYVSPLHLGLVYLGFGDMDACFDWLDKAVEERDSMIFMISVNPLFDPLRSHPRYHALLRKMNLEK